MSACCWRRLNCISLTEPPQVQILYHGPITTSQGQYGMDSPIILDADLGALQEHLAARNRWKFPAPWNKQHRKPSRFACKRPAAATHGRERIAGDRTQWASEQIASRTLNIDLAPPELSLWPLGSWSRRESMGGRSKAKRIILHAPSRWAWTLSEQDGYRASKRLAVIAELQNAGQGDCTIEAAAPERKLHFEHKRASASGSELRSG